MMYKEELDYKRFIEIERILEEGDYDIVEQQNLEDEQKEIILHRYKEYMKLVLNLKNELEQKYGKFFDNNDFEIYFGPLDIEEIQNIYFYEKNLKYENGNIGKPYIEIITNDWRFLDFQIQVERLFDLNISKEYFFAVVYNKLNEINDEIIQLKDKLDSLENISYNIDKLINYENMIIKPLDDFRYE